MDSNSATAVMRFFAATDPMNWSAVVGLQIVLDWMTARHFKLFPGTDPQRPLRLRRSDGRLPVAERSFKKSAFVKRVIKFVKDS